MTEPDSDSPLWHSFFAMSVSNWPSDRLMDASLKPRFESALAPGADVPLIIAGIMADTVYESLTADSIITILDLCYYDLTGRRLHMFLRQPGDVMEDRIEHDMDVYPSVHRWKPGMKP